MKFNISFMFPASYRFAHFLHDMASTFLHGLLDLGHHAILSRQLVDPGYVNVLIGAHTFDSPAAVSQLKQAGIPYVVVQSEIIRGDTINLGMQDRFNAIYKPLMQGAAGVWDFYQENVAALAAQGIEAQLTQLGYHPALEVVRHRQDKDIDALFFGSVTERRAKVLQGLQDAGVKVAALFDDPAFFRNDMIARSKLQLNLRHDEAMTHMPTGRIKFLVNNRCLVVGETALESETVDDLFLAAEPEDFVALVRDTLARDDRQAVTDEFYERYKARPMSGYLAPLVEALG
ncbi:MAG: hypothetical protein KC731_34095 [Myxococcales bacterium]|nr:hypothetical protein [Myxococcales bacterium]